jgi:DNA replication protein DnaC
LISVQPETGGSFAARCLCRQGQRKSPAIASMGSVYDAASLARMFPAGLPAAVDPLPGLMTAAGVPARGIVWTFDSYRAHFSQTPMAVRYAEYGPLWAKKPLAQRSDLVLYGTHGVGKSGFTVALARQLLAQGERVKWWYVPELLLAWQATFSGKGDTHAFFEELVGYDVLMLDELMGQKATEFVESTLTTIVNARQRAERPTILTLNVTAASADAERRELTTLLGTALMDRLAEHAELWPFRGASQRPVYKRR